jgi:hypothetical protein
MEGTTGEELIVSLMVFPLFWLLLLLHDEGTRRMDSRFFLYFSTTRKRIMFFVSEMLQDFPQAANKKEIIATELISSQTTRVSDTHRKATSL